MNFASPVADHRQHDLRRLLLRPGGHYSADGRATSTRTARRVRPCSRSTVAPLHALRNTDGTANGLYPTAARARSRPDSYDAANYWVDVVFTPEHRSGDRARSADHRDGEPPGNASAVVSWTAPSDGASAITELHGHAVRRHDRADADHGDRQPAGDQHHGHAA